MNKKLKNFTYKYNKGAGPLPESVLERENFTEGNCRLAVQYFLYKVKNIFLEPKEVLLPNGYKNVGEFVFKEESINFEKLKRGDIVYAENLRNKKDELLNRGKKSFKDEDEWILHLHSAIFLGKLDDELANLLPEGEHSKDSVLIWHSTSIDGGTAVWTLDKFLKYYKPISAKRVS